MTSLGPNNPAAGPRSRQGDTPAREYSRLWRSETPRLDDFLAKCSGLAPAELAAIVQIDLRERWTRSERPDARQYLDRFPQLLAEPDLAVDIVYAEYLVREQRGDRPTLDEFTARFPEFAGVLADQVSLHEAFGDEPLESAKREVANDDSKSTGDDDFKQPPRSLEGDYEIIEELGRGGMGVVYKARQPALNRLVALKMVRRADLDNVELVARFRAEAAVVASLHHPHIVQIYDYGQHDGAPYLALELVAGGPLSERLNGTPWNPRRAAALLEQVARAVHFAHERGVVHRDLKPSNLLVSREGEQLELKIADFGLAKVFRDDAAAHTQSGTLLGTPSYMAPEQAYGRTGAVGPAADVYALGAILYELLSGRPPYRGETAIETLQQLLLGEPASIHRLTPSLPRDLATICSKCLERTPERRYASALDVADDLHRFLIDRPIRARRISGWEHGWRWCRRNPALAAALGSVAALLVAVSAVSTWYSSRLSRQLDNTRRAELAERKANDESQLRLWDAYLAEISARNSSRQLGQRFAALQTVERAQQLLPTIGTTDQRQLQLRNAAITSVSLPDLRRVRRIWGGPKAVYNGAAALAADRFACNLQDDVLIVGRVSDGAILATVEHGLTPVQAILAPDARFAGVSGEGGSRVWRITDAGLEPAWQSDDARWLSFAPDGRHAVVSRAGVGLSLVDAASGEMIRILSDGEAMSPCSFHAPSRRLAVCTAKEVRIVAWETSELIASLPLPEGAPPQLAWHPSGDYLATWGSHTIALWNVRTRKQIVSLPHTGYPQQLHFSPDGASLVSCSLWDSRLMLWDVGTGQKQLDVQAFANLAMDIGPTGRLELLKLDGNSVELWELAPGSECRSLPRAWFPSLGTCARADISPDSRLLALSGERGLELWDLQRCQRLSTQHGSLCMAMFDRQGNLIVARSSGIYRWPRHDRMHTPEKSDRPTKIVSLGPPERVIGVGVPTSLATCKPNGVLLYEGVGGWYATSLTKRGRQTQIRPPGDPRKAALSSDDRIAAIASWEAGGATVWDVATGNRLADLPIGRCGMLEFSPDGRWLATTPGGVQIWRTSDWSLEHELHAHGTTPNGLGMAFSSDSRALAIGQPNGELRLVDPQSGRDWARIMHPAPGSGALIAFAPDNRNLVVMPADGQSPARIWNLAEMRRSLRELGLDWPAEVLRVEPQPPEDVGPLEIEWNDGGWLLLNSAVQSLRGEAPATSN